MGNFSSCIKTQNSSHSKNIAKLVDTQGKITLVNLPITVAELMLENPGFAPTLIEDLRETRRIPAMKADEKLLGRKVYLLLPVDKVNSRLTDLQLASVDSLLCSCNNNKKVGGRTRGGSKVSPILDEHNLEELVKDLTGGNGQRKRFCKVWEPVLEPILE